MLNYYYILCKFSISAADSVNMLYITNTQAISLPKTNSIYDIFHHATTLNIGKTKDR